MSDLSVIVFVFARLLPTPRLVMLCELFCQLSGKFLLFSLIGICFWPLRRTSLALTFMAVTPCTNTDFFMKKTKPDIAFGDLTNHTGYHIRRAHSTFVRLFTTCGREHLLKSQQSSILVLTRENPGISPAAIAAAIDIKRSLMAKLMTDLAERGFIETRSSPVDGRQLGLYITAKGNKFICTVMDSFWNKLEPALTGSLSESERKTLIRLLTKIYAPR
jgi:DNA-binding MarR family transcriptional regulator